MADSPSARLGAAHLDDLAIIILTTPPGAEPGNAHPELDADERARLRSRLKLISRHDWPSSKAEDQSIRRGYTLRQCLRLMVALQLVDARIPLSLAVPIARNNEIALLRVITERLTNAERPSPQDDLIGVVIPGELWERLAPVDSDAAAFHRIRFVPRADLPSLWSRRLDLGGPGSRIVIDFVGAALTLWRWARTRDLLPEAALSDLSEEVGLHRSDPGFLSVIERSRRR